MAGLDGEAGDNKVLLIYSPAGAQEPLVVPPLGAKVLSHGRAPKHILLHLQALVPSQDMMVQVRAQMALIHAQWIPSEKKHIFYSILQCFGAVYFYMSGRFETVLYFFPPWEKACLY